MTKQRLRPSRASNDASPEARSDGEGITTTGPVFAVCASTKCWKCAADQSVIAVGVADARCGEEQVERDDDTPGLFVLSRVTSMPAPIKAYLADEYPQYRWTYSRMAEMAYFANTCSACGANFGDFFLFDEPDGPFFPSSYERRRFDVRRLPFDGSFEFEAECSYLGLQQEVTR